MKALFHQFDGVTEFPHTQRGRIDREDGKTIVRVYDPRETRPEFATEAFTAWDDVPGLKAVAIRAYLKEATKGSVTSHLARKQLAELFKALSAIFVAAGLDDRTPETLTL